MNKYYLFAFIAVFINAFAQLILKKGALVSKQKGGFVHLFLNPFSITGYILFLLVTLCNLFALKKIKLIEMIYIEPVNYLIVIIFSIIIFKEKVSKQQIWGISLIIIGMIIFNLN